MSKITVNTRYEDLPKPVVHEAKDLIMDLIGNGLAAITTDPGKKAISLAKDLTGTPESSIIGAGYKVSCNNAAFANGQLFNALDFDTVMPGGYTPLYIVPAQLEIAERVDALGKDLIVATALGLKGDTELFDDTEHGFGKFCGYTSFNPEKILPELGQTWDFIQVNYKKYACCTMLMAPLEVFCNIIHKNNLRPEDIESVHVLTSPTVESLLFTSRELNNISDIQFGMHYVIALAAYGYKTGIEWQDWNTVNDPRITDFSKKSVSRGILSSVLIVSPP